MPDPVSPFRLDGRHAVVTGAGTGIGRATAVVYARLGATPVISDIDGAALAATAALIAPAAHPYAADQRAATATDGFAAFARALGPIDI